MYCKLKCLFHVTAQLLDAIALVITLERPAGAGAKRAKEDSSIQERGLEQLEHLVLVGVQLNYSSESISGSNTHGLAENMTSGHFSTSLSAQRILRLEAGA